MGALTSNRKRGDGCFSLSCPYLTPDSECRADLHMSKKPRISFMNFSPDQALPSKSRFTRINWYPEPIQPIRREVHAPCRKSKFGPPASSSKESRVGASRENGKEVSADEMGNYLSQYYQAKNDAIDTLRHLTKDKELNDVEDGCSKDVISEDSSIEEVEILDEGRKRHSVISDKRSRETNVNVFLQEAYAKFTGNLPQQSTSEVDYTGKMMESLSVRGMEELRILPHKRLYESAEKRNPRLGSLNFQIRLQLKKLSLLPRHQLKKPEEDVLREPFASHTEEEVAEVSHAFSGSNRRKVLVKHENSNIEITGEILQCLRPGAWLNDEVINLYLELLKEREKREPKKYLKCHFFNTFFYKKLHSGRNGYDFKAVRRWTTQRKIGYGLFECDKIFIPVHKEIHWCLAVINKKDEKFQYLDSLKGMDSQVLKVLAKYFVDEVKDKSGKDINVSSWKQEYVDDLPEQENGWDCGMFMIKYADFYSRGLGLCFKQEHMPYFRVRTAKEILRLKAE